jgi:hypothetical protein
MGDSTDAEVRKLAESLFYFKKKGLAGPSESHEVHVDGEELRNFGI